VVVGLGVLDGVVEVILVCADIGAGEPFGEEIVMWWNFIGRSNDDVVAAREAWDAGPERFGTVPGYVGPVDRIPAPALPGVRLKPRGNRGRSGFAGGAEAPALS
jgi:hypothetical protein